MDLRHQIPACVPGDRHHVPGAEGAPGQQNQTLNEQDRSVRRHPVHGTGVR